MVCLLWKHNLNVKSRENLSVSYKHALRMRNSRSLRERNWERNCITQSWYPIFFRYPLNLLSNFSILSLKWSYTFIKWCAQELKGNIRVFCRVRPLLPDENSAEGKSISYPTSMEAFGRGIDLVQNGICSINTVLANPKFLQIMGENWDLCIFLT